MNIRQMSSEELSHRISETGKLRAKAEANYVYHNEYRKIILESVFLDLQEADSSLTATKAKSQARISSVFKESVDALVAATEAKFLAYADYKETDFEIKRRLNASFSKNQEWNSQKLNT